MLLLNMMKSNPFQPIFLISFIFSKQILEPIRNTFSCIIKGGYDVLVCVVVSPRSHFDQHRGYPNSIPTTLTNLLLRKMSNFIKTNIFKKTFYFKNRINFCSLTGETLNFFYVQKPLYKV